MTKPPMPAWALTVAGPQDRLAAQRAQGLGVMQIKWPADGPPRAWAKRHGWPTPWFGFEEAFIDRLLSNDESFELALRESGIEISILRTSHSISAEELAGLDEGYRNHSWRWLVEALRDIRRAVEAGVVVRVEGETLKSFQSFYDWAHGRYHSLEDDTRTGWIGDDSRHPYG